MLLNVEHLYKYFNGQALLKDINFTVEDREAVGLIGVNGCGKSTLLNIITGSEGFDKTPEGLGSVNIAGKASIGFLRQNSGLNSELTIGEEMKNAFAPLLETLEKMKALEKKMAEGGDIDSISHEYAELSSYFEARDGYRIDVKIKQVLNGMKDLLPQRLIPVVLDMSYVDENKFINQVSREERHRLLQTLKHFVITISATRPIAEAIVTAGGVSVKEIDPKTMESKRIKGLYFAGEVMDVDGYTGGYNLQAAFSSGHAAGEAAAAEE